MNLLSRDAGDVAFVLDDYHVITADPVQRGMTFLLEHLLPQLHLVLASRADPPLPLSRLRAQGQLTEVRTADLRFDTEEASTFLQAVMGLDLGASAIARRGRSDAGNQIIVVVRVGRGAVPGIDHLILAAIGIVTVVDR